MSKSMKIAKIVILSQNRPPEANFGGVDFVKIQDFDDFSSHFHEKSIFSRKIMKIVSNVMAATFYT